MSDTRYIDLSHVVRPGMVTYPGLPGPVVSEFMSREASRGHYAEGVEFHVGKVTMVANTGTYVDAPFHRYADGQDLAGLPLEVLAGLDAVVARHDMGKGRAIGAEDLRGPQLSGRALLVHTGWDRHWGTQAYFEAHPYLTREAVEFLLEEARGSSGSIR